MNPVHRTRYDRKSVTLGPFEPTLTKQAMKDECDIHQILRQHAQGNLLSHVNQIEAQFGDFDNVEDYQTALNRVMHAQEAFASLPSNVRARFDHNPGALLAFLSDESNRDEAIALGLLEKPVLAPSSPLSALADADIAPPAAKKGKSQSNASD